MKTITIGRGPENMVTLNDIKTSRRHALLRCHPTGKLEIVDLSQNGTFVNGMRIPSNKPYPLTRKDIVIFAHAETLDWNEVPNPYKYIKYATILLTTCIIVLCLGTGITAYLNSQRGSIEDTPEFVGPSDPTSVNKSETDSILPQKKRKKEITIPQKPKIRKESKTDSVQQKSSDNEQDIQKNNPAHNKEQKKEEREMDVIL